MSNAPPPTLFYQTKPRQVFTGRAGYNWNRSPYYTEEMTPAKQIDVAIATEESAEVAYELAYQQLRSHPAFNPFLGYVISVSVTNLQMKV